MELIKVTEMKGSKVTNEATMTKSDLQGFLKNWNRYNMTNVEHITYDRETKKILKVKRGERV